MEQLSGAYLQVLTTGRLANLHHVETSSMNLDERTFALTINASCIHTAYCLAVNRSCKSYTHDFAVRMESCPQPNSAVSTRQLQVMHKKNTSKRFAAAETLSSLQNHSFV